MFTDYLFAALDQSIDIDGVHEYGAYGTTLCRELALKNPDKAAENADSIILFALGQYISLLLGV